MQLCLTVIVFEDCPDHLRTTAGVPDFDRLVPPDTDALTVLTTAEQQRTLFGRGLDEELRNVEDQVAGTGRARAAVQRVLDQIPHGAAGRERMLDIRLRTARAPTGHRRSHRRPSATAYARPWLATSTSISRCRHDRLEGCPPPGSDSGSPP
ncbi:hypothetical protein [Streptomyces sp. NPDC058103]|uniref:hypothetical protein n=1 Tax=Streptomyces sp. NPDC058103 TaxID=3346341 RepID=UPI0036E416FE